MAIVNIKNTLVRRTVLVASLPMLIPAYIFVYLVLDGVRGGLEVIKEVPSSVADAWRGR
jgi:hypothetical protein